MKRMWSKNELKKNVEEIAASGNLPSVKADEIIENMSGYAASLRTIENITVKNIYCGIVKNGNKLTIVHAFNFTKNDAGANGGWLVDYTIPANIGQKLFPTQIGQYEWLVANEINVFSDLSAKKAFSYSLYKNTNTNLILNVAASDLTVNTKYYVRIEMTFLLGENLIPQE